MYDHIAAAIAATDIDDSTTAESLVGRLADNIAAVFAKSDPSFSRDSFLWAAGIDPTTLEVVLS